MVENPKPNPKPITQKPLTLKINFKLFNNQVNWTNLF